MALNIVYGFGGFCKDCDSSHNHPLNNIVSSVEVEDEVEQQIGE
jgi:hypothetical protein